MSHITQTDIAKKLKISRVTVSKALRDHPDISSKMKQKILKVAKEMSYVPNMVAQNLNLKKTCSIGVVIPDLENTFFAYAADSIIDAADEKNFNAFITVSREKEENESSNIKKLIGMRVDGLLVCVSQQTRDKEIFEHIKKLKIPLVFFDRQFEGLGFSSVTFDDYNGAVSAVTKIIESGYSKIAHFAGFSSVGIGKNRRLGYVDTLKKNRIKINQDWILEAGFEKNDGYNSFIKLYDSKKLPEIIFTVNDRVALGVYHAALEKGIRIPEDIGIVGFGFNEIAQTFSPTLTIVNQDPRKIGSAATELLIEIINNSRVKKKNVIEEEIIWNKSIIRKNKS